MCRFRAQLRATATKRTANLSQASYLQKPYSPTRPGRLLRDILQGETKLPVPDTVPENGKNVCGFAARGG